MFTGAEIGTSEIVNSTDFGASEDFNSTGFVTSNIFHNSSVALVDLSISQISAAAEFMPVTHGHVGPYVSGLAISQEL